MSRSYKGQTSQSISFCLSPTPCDICRCLQASSFYLRSDTRCHRWEHKLCHHRDRRTTERNRCLYAYLSKGLDSTHIYRIGITTPPHSPDRWGRRGDMRDALCASLLQLVRYSALLIRVGVSILVLSLMLSSQLFACFLLLMVARRGSCGPAIDVTWARTKSLILRSDQEIPSMRLKHLVSNVWTLLVVSAVMVQLSQP